MKKTVVIPFHDGEQYLKYSLPSLRDLPVDEFVIIFDRISAKMQRLFERYFPKNQRPKCKFLLIREPSEENCKIINMPEEALKKWVHARARIFNMGLGMAEGDLLFVSAEDIILDPKNFDERFWEDPDVGMVDFRYKNYEPDGINIRNAWLWILVKIVDRIGRRKATQRSGIYGVRKSVFDSLGIEDVPTEEDWLRRRIVEHGFKHIHIIDHKKNIHMRTSQDKERQLMQGKTRYLQGDSILKVLGHCVLYLKPYVVLGFIKERMKHARD